MPVKFIAVYCLLLTACGLISINSVSAQTKTELPKQLSIGILQSGMPLSGQNEKHETTGIYVEFLDTFTQQLGIQANYVSMPLQRVQSSLLGNQSDLAIWITTKKKSIVKSALVDCFSPGLIALPASIYTHGRAISEPARVGLLVSFDKSMLDKMFADIGVFNYSQHQLKTINALFKSLASNRIDYVLSTDIGAEYWQAHLHTTFKAVQELNTAEAFLCYRHDRFNNEALAQLRKAYLEALKMTDVVQLKQKYLRP